jgi:hypothetical protein
MTPTDDDQVIAEVTGVGTLWTVEVRPGADDASRYGVFVHSGPTRLIHSRRATFVEAMDTVTIAVAEELRLEGGIT